MTTLRSEVTAREAEVLALVGQHLTNAQIAEALGISVRTAESHVAALIRKFGVSDRRSLARHAAADRGRGAERCRCRRRRSWAARSSARN